MIAESTKRSLIDEILGHRFISQKAICEMLKLHPSTIYRNEKAGRFPKRVKLSGGSVRWREADINAFAESGGKFISAEEWQKHDHANAAKKTKGLSVINSPYADRSSIRHENQGRNTEQVKTTAQRVQNHRMRMKHDDKDQFEIIISLSLSALNALSRMAKYKDITQKQLLDTLLFDTEDKLLKGFDDAELERYFNVGKDERVP